MRTMMKKINHTSTKNMFLTLNHNWETKNGNIKIKQKLSYKTNLVFWGWSSHIRMNFFTSMEHQLR